MTFFLAISVTLKKAEMFSIKNPALEITGLTGTLYNRLWTLGNR